MKKNFMRIKICITTNHKRYPCFFNSAVNFC